MGYAVKLQKGGTQIYNGDKVDVILSGSNTGTFTFTVVYTTKTEVCLLSDSNMGNAAWSAACAKSWDWECKLGSKTYRSSDTGQSIAKIPTLKQSKTKCHYIERPQANPGGVTGTLWFSDQRSASSGYPCSPSINGGTKGDTVYDDYWSAGQNFGSYPYISIIL